MAVLLLAFSSGTISEPGLLNWWGVGWKKSLRETQLSDTELSVGAGVGKQPAVLLAPPSGVEPLSSHWMQGRSGVFRLLHPR